MPKEPQVRVVSRQRPVSCRFCRSRKLRCSREAPCSNCTSRGIACDLESPGPSPESDNTAKYELLERIRKLEELVEKVRRSPQAYHGELDGFDTSTEATESSTSRESEELRGDVAMLEKIYDGTNHARKDIPPNMVEFRVASMQSISQARQLADRDGPPLSCSLSRRRFVLPEYSDAKILLDKFIQDLECFFHHVAHIPSLPGTLDHLYSSLNQQSELSPGEAILMMSIFSSATHSWTEMDCEQRGLFHSPAEAHAQSIHWLTATEDLVEIARRNTRLSIDAIQGIIVLKYIPENLEGLARRCRWLNSTAILLARELGLHCIDHPSNAALANTAQAEIGRRLWWHIVSTDWAMAARFYDSHQGVYQCHTRHMMTNKPLNLDDEDVVDGMVRVGRPMSQPTEMSYPLLRIRLCEICRNIVDRSPLLAGSPMNYDVIVDIDTEFQSLLNDVPPFFSMTVADISRTYNFDRSRAAVIARQGHIFYSLFYSQRCKLHLPFLSRGFADRKYALSRDICIQSANRIIQTEGGIENTGLCTARSYKPMGMILSVFLACIVLLMDLCYAKDRRHEERQRADIAIAFRLLEDARDGSAISAKFLDSMMHILKKHNILPPKRVGPRDVALAPVEPVCTAAAPNGFVSEQGCGPDSMMTPNLATGVVGGIDMPGLGTTWLGTGMGNDLSFFNGLVQTLDHGPNAGNINWDNMFLGLDSTFM